MSSLIFISSALQQPRHQKRIDLLLAQYDLKVFYFLEINTWIIISIILIMQRKLVR